MEIRRLVAAIASVLGFSQVCAVICTGKTWVGKEYGVAIWNMKVGF
jgi:hypothetical protein